MGASFVHDAAALGTSGSALSTRTDASRRCVTARGVERIVMASGSKPKRDRQALRGLMEFLCAARTSGRILFVRGSRGEKVHRRRVQGDRLIGRAGRISAALAQIHPRRTRASKPNDILLGRTAGL